jgi:toxin CcdB
VAQFHVYRNRNPAAQKRFPLLLDVQSDLLEPLASRVVIPLSPTAGGNRAAMKTLTPSLRIEGKDYLAMTPQLAGIALAELGAPVADASAHREAIVAALDLLISGF